MQGTLFVGMLDRKKACGIDAVLLGSCLQA